ncbi:MAG TPA: radical SAM protein [Candidatus Coprocola pullicola]|nr:radical SAM protein [Candidatus Coprocola pullicola]
MESYVAFMKHCTICPRNCGVNRYAGEKGFCQAALLPKCALASIHHWEEPPISGTKGSGTVFFSHCNLGCIFCQNHTISQEDFGKELTIEHLSDIFLSQQKKNVHNINIVSPTQYLPQIREALILSKQKGLRIPVVYNTNGYEKAESLKLLEGLIDIYLPDFKYISDKYSNTFSLAKDYAEYAKTALLEMKRQVPENVFSSDGILQKGILIRHLILPGCYQDSFSVLEWIYKNLGQDTYISLLNQYTPMYKAKQVKQLSRKLTTLEYQKVTDYFFQIGLKNGFIQKKSSATTHYTPIFDLSGLS